MWRNLKEEVGMLLLLLLLLLLEATDFPQTVPQNNVVQRMSLLRDAVWSNQQHSHSSTTQGLAIDYSGRFNVPSTKKKFVYIYIMCVTWKAANSSKVCQETDCFSISVEGICSLAHLGEIKRKILVEEEEI